MIATDAAREGINLQNHCADLFHFDLPWNPSRLEQRNGRIDRKLQQAKVVRCHYFVIPKRPEDRVLDTLVRKSDAIYRDLGSLPLVVVDQMRQCLAQGINTPEQLVEAMELIDAPGSRGQEAATISGLAAV